VQRALPSELQLSSEYETFRKSGAGGLLDTKSFVLLGRAMRNTRRPTEAEMNILGVFWERGPATVREVYEQLQASQDVGHTTVLKLMQIMVEKGLLERDASVRPQVFRATQQRKRTQSLLVRDLLDRAFAGSPSALVVQALSLRKSSPEELQEIRAVLDRLEEQE